MSSRDRIGPISLIGHIGPIHTGMLKEEVNGINFIVRVIPRSSKSEIVGEMDGAVKVRLTSPPVDGAANAELTKLFAKVFGVSRSDVEIVSGETSKTKRLRLTGVTAARLRSVLDEKR